MWKNMWIKSKKSPLNSLYNRKCGQIAGMCIILSGISNYLTGVCKKDLSSMKSCLCFPDYFKGSTLFRNKGAAFFPVCIIDNYREISLI